MCVHVCLKDRGVLHSITPLSGRLSVMVGIYIQSNQTPDGGRLQACSWTGSYRRVSPLFYRIKTLSLFCPLILQLIQ